MDSYIHNASSLFNSSVLPAVRPWMDQVYTLDPQTLLPYVASILLVIVNMSLLKGKINVARATALAKKEPSVVVSQLLVHPIKSCKGISVKETRYTPEGFEHDRTFVLVNPKTHKFISARDFPKMVLIEPSLLPDANSPFGGRLSVSFPKDAKLPSFEVPLAPTQVEMHTKNWEYMQDILFWGGQLVDGYIVPAMSPESRSPSDIISDYLGAPVLLVIKGHVPRPVGKTSTHPNLKATAVFQDGYPLLLASTESLKDVQDKIGLAARKGKDFVVGGMDYSKWKTGEVTMERFRPNVVFSGLSGPWKEDLWEDIEIGDTRQAVSLVSKCGRCLLPNVDPQTGVRDAAVPYKVIQKFRRVDATNPNEPCFGINAVPKGFGVFRVGDKVRIVKMLPPQAPMPTKPASS